LSEVQKILDAQVLCCGGIIDEVEVQNACGADLLSDVLAFTKEHTLLLTGMTNLQVIRTAEISDLDGVVFVRGKMPRPDVLKAAEEKNIPVLLTEYTMYEACGRLYKNGLPGCARTEGALLNV
jgi:predicted transcriptional regulator